MLQQENGVKKTSVGCENFSFDNKEESEKEDTRCDHYRMSATFFCTLLFVETLSFFRMDGDNSILSYVFNTSHTVLGDMPNFNEKPVCITRHAIPFYERPACCNTEHTNSLLM